MVSIDKVETVRKFKVDNHPGFFIEEFNNGLETEFWLYHENYGVKMLMFGFELYLLNNPNSYDDYISILLSRQIEDYIDIYMIDYIKEEI